MHDEHDKGWVGVDLDGTLAHYDHWRGADHIGEPVAQMVARVKKWLADGYEVRIFTARVTNGSTISMAHLIAAETVKRWLVGVAGLPRLEVTNVKDFRMIELWDDRAVQVLPNTGQPVGHSTRGLDA